MNTNDLIKLAEQADFEGDYELADYIDNQLRISSHNKNTREAANIGTSISNMFKPVGRALGKIPEFFGYGKYNAPVNWSKPAVDLATSNPNISGNAFQKALGSINKEINLDANQVKNLENTLLQQMTSSIGQADVPTVKAIEKLVNKEFSKLTIAEKNLIAKYARETGIVGRRTDADFTDILDLVSGKPLQVRPRTVQRVNPNAKLLAGGLAGASLIPGMAGMMAGQGPDTTGSAIPTGPAGMPQLDPMGGFSGGFGGGYNGPQVGGPGMGGGYAPTQPIGLGYANTVTDPASNRESAGYAPTSQYTGRSEREINPAAKYRSYEGMMRGEGAPAYNNQSYVGGYSQPTVNPVITPQVNVQPVAGPEQLTSVPPVNTEAAPQALPANFADALRPATPEEAARYEQPPAAPMTPEQIGAAMNPLATSGY
jgi:hypothetical protein